MAAKAAPREASGPETVQAWLMREHRFLQRYLAVVNKTAHDYRYGYQTPVPLLPVTLDLFTGYVARIHAMEEACIYPAVDAKMSPDQQKHVQLILGDQQEESAMVKTLLRQAAALTPGSSEAFGETADDLARMINRHIVLQEQHLLPVLEALTPKEQAAVLLQLARHERELLGPTGRERAERLLAWIGDQVAQFGGRVW